MQLLKVKISGGPLDNQTWQTELRRLDHRGFSWRPCWRAETIKQFCMKIDLISQRRENVLFLPSSMAAMTSHENVLLAKVQLCEYRSQTLEGFVAASHLYAKFDCETGL